MSIVMNWGGLVNRNKIGLRVWCGVAAVAEGGEQGLPGQLRLWTAVILNGGTKLWWAAASALFHTLQTP